MADTGIKSADDQLETYEEQLQETCAKALAVRIKRSGFEREMDQISTDNTLVMFLTGGGDVENPSAKKWLKKQRTIHRKSIKLLADDIFSGRYSDTDG